MRWVKTGTAPFRKALAEAEGRGAADSARVAPVVADVIAKVREGGDEALAAFTLRFDGFDPRKGGFAVPAGEIEAAYRRVSPELRGSLEVAAERIGAFHRKQADKGYVHEIPGATLRLRVTPVARAGVYVPGGKAAYPSTLLMNAIPAKVAGVAEVVAACAAPGGTVPDVVLAAARIAGLSAVYRVGGAQAVAALALGTRSIPRVDVIAGPGNAYVTEAKRQLFGEVGIDMLAGPSELAVLADSSARAPFVAADLLSQAEHDADAFVVLVTDDPALAKAVDAEVARQAKLLPRGEILSGSLPRAVGFLVKDMEEGAALVDRIAPEHLSVMTRHPERSLARIRNAGTAFLGPWSPVAVGDYLAGINHTLPTGGAARFASPLGVANFLRRTNVVSYRRGALRADAPHVTRIAENEGLVAHAEAVRVRTKGGK